MDELHDGGRSGGGCFVVFHFLSPLTKGDGAKNVFLISFSG